MILVRVSVCGDSERLHISVSDGSKLVKYKEMISGESIPNWNFLFIAAANGTSAGCMLAIIIRVALCEIRQWTVKE